MMYTYMGSNKGRSLAFRNDVILYLHDLGFTSADRRPEAKRLSRAMREALDVGDIVGLPWTLGVRCQQSIDLSGSLDQAAREARTAGSELFASIQMRRAHPTGQSYVTMPLSVFTRVLAMTPPTPAPTVAIE